MLIEWFLLNYLVFDNVLKTLGKKKKHNSWNVGCSENIQK